MSRIIAIFKAVTKNWLRSRSGVFFSFLFPVMLLLLFGYVLGNPGSSYRLYVQNNDVCPSSSQCFSTFFVEALNSTKVVSVNTEALQATSNVTEFIKERSALFGGTPRVLIIPSNFSQSIVSNQPTGLVYISSPDDQLGRVVGGVISSVADAFNFRIAGTTPLISIAQQSSSFRLLRNVDYYVPAYIGAFVMTNGVIGLTSIASEFKRRGLIKRLSATPLSRFEWVLGNVLSQALLGIMLTGVMIGLGFLLFSVSVTIDIYVAAVILLGSVMFSGVGMLLAGLVKDPEAASGLGNAIAFPMMFLSGTFWPTDIMPPILQSVARVLPLTYFSEALRDSMILNNTSAALINTGTLAVLAASFILLGSQLTRWKEK